MTLGRQHAILRTIFCVVDGQVVQVALRPESMCSRIHNIVVAGDLREAANNAIRVLHSKPNVWYAPTAQLCLFSNAMGSLILLNFSHSLNDSWSIEMLSDELLQMYTGSKSRSSERKI